MIMRETSPHTCVSVRVCGDERHNRVCMYVCMYVCIMYVCICVVYVCMYVCMYVSMYLCRVCMYVYVSCAFFLAHFFSAVAHISIYLSIYLFTCSICPFQPTLCQTGHLRLFRMHPLASCPRVSLWNAKIVSSWFTDTIDTHIRGFSRQWL